MGLKVRHKSHTSRRNGLPIAVCGSAHGRLVTPWGDVNCDNCLTKIGAGVKRPEAETTLEGMLSLGDIRAEKIHASEDAEVLALCERLGYGAVMDSAARLWHRKDPMGCFVVGPCRGTLLHLLKKG